MQGLFLSTLSLRRATQQDGHQHAGYPISIHALLAESDRLESINLLPDRYFYPRSPCGERPADPDGGGENLRISIHALLAESDGRQASADSPRSYFYPRSPCGERRWPKRAHLLPTLISIHALLAESDRSACRMRSATHKFLSTLSLRRATGGAQPYTKSRYQFLSTLSLRRATIFDNITLQGCAAFLSTLSLRRATHKHGGDDP